MKTHYFGNTSFITHCTIAWAHPERGNPWMWDMYRTINRLVADNLHVPQAVLLNRVRNHLHAAFNAHDEVFSLWVSTRGDRHITVTLTLFDVAKLKFRIAVPSLRNEAEIKTKARYDIGCLIGDLSQDFYECSYNDDDVYLAWRNGSLNEHWTKYMDDVRKDTTLRTGTMNHLFKIYLPDDPLNWEGLLETLYNLAEGWPIDWLSNYKTHEELALIPAYTR